MKDLIPALYGLGHDIIITSKIGVIGGKIQQTRMKEKCEWSNNFADIVFTDLYGAHDLKQFDQEFFDEIKCKLRVLDPFGTDSWFNDPSIVEKSGYENKLGGLGLPSIKQFLTRFPHDDHEWSGFIMYPDSTDYSPTTESNNTELTSGIPKALIQVRNSSLLTGHEATVKTVSQQFEVHFTIPEETFDLSQLTDSTLNHTNHGFLQHRDYIQLLKSIDLVIGIGFPYEDLTGIEAISNGAFYLNQKFPKSKGRLNFIKNGLGMYKR